MRKLKKVKGIKIAIIILLAIVFVQFDTIAKAEEKKEKSPIELKVSYGIDGKFKSVGSVPIRVELTNNGDDIQGEVQVKIPSGSLNTYDLFATEVSVKKGESFKTTIPIDIKQEMKNIRVEVTNGKEVVANQKVVLDTGRVNDFDLFMGTLTGDFNGISYFSELKLISKFMGPNQAVKSVNVPLNIEDIYKSYKNISSLDVIVLDNYNVENLKEEHYKNLSTWINNGGILIIGSGANSNKTLGALNKDFLDFSKGETTEKTVELGGESITTQITDVNVNDGKTLIENNGSKLVQSVERGKGAILVAAFDLGTEPMSSYTGTTKLWENIIQPYFEKIYESGPYGKGSSDFYMLSNMTQAVPLAKSPNIILTVIVLAIYVIIVGGGLYFVLGKLKKKDYMWTILPCIAIGFSVLLYIMGFGTRIKDLVLNQVTTITIDENGNGIPVGIVGIGNKYKSDLMIEEPEGTEIEYLSNPNKGMYMDPSKDINYEKLDIKILYRDNGSYYSFADSAALELKTFKVAGTEQKIDKFNTLLKYDSGLIKGSIKNNLSDDVEKMILVVGSNVWDLGKITKNNQLDFEGKNPDSTNGLQEYVYTHHPNYGMQMGGSTKVLNGKNEGRYLDLLSSLSFNFQGKSGAYLIAVTEKSIDYGINLGSNSVSKYDITTIIQKIEIDYKDSNGNVSYPAGYFEAKVYNKDSTVSLDTMGNFLYGNGVVEFQYEIPTNVVIEKIDFPPVNQNYAPTRISEVLLYNYESAKYDKVSLGESGNETTEAEKYIKDNKIRIKVEVDDQKGGGIIPQIGIKGREK